MEVEVLIYVKKVENHITNDDFLREYYIGNENSDIFYKELIYISQQNFIETGFPELTQEQFEFIKLNKPQNKENFNYIFNYSNDFEPIILN